MVDLNDAITYVEKKHAGQKRKDGSDYVTHPLKVALELLNKKYDLNVVFVGLFHDLLEDTDATEEEILALSNPAVLKAVKILTKSKNVDSETYIQRILEDPIAKVVKNVDRIQNLQDAYYADEKFAKRYAENTKRYYLRKFSKELDFHYERLCEKLGITEYTYSIDTSLSESATPIFRQDSVNAWKFNKQTGEWEDTDPYYWAILGDDAETISEEQVNEIIQQFLR